MKQEPTTNSDTVLDREKKKLTERNSVSTMRGRKLKQREICWSFYNNKRISVST